jgi:8-oxo-dGTP pyrophosphatase MutT (NUDIX family)
MKDTDPKPWKLIREEPGPDLGLFKARYHWKQNPRNGRVLKRLVLECNDWVNVVAVTPEEEIVVVRQYRFGNQKITTEIPGGIIDPGESSKEAAIRELKEETGYTSSNWTYLGPVEPNPAFHTNLCHQWLAEGAKQTHPPEPDMGEDIRVRLLTLKGLRLEIKEGRLWHALALSALSRVFDLWKDLDDYAFLE